MGDEFGRNSIAFTTEAVGAESAPPMAPWYAPPPDEDEQAQYTFAGAGSFILDAADRPACWWGIGNDIIGADGEALLVAGPMGTGKSTLAQQLALGRAGFTEYSELIGYPVTRARRRVLYLGMDRPRQIARSLRRMVGEAWRDELDDRIAVWSGPPPKDMARHTSLLRRMAEDAGASFVVVDSLKDAALGLTDDETGAAWNRARQDALAHGINLCELHHTRKVAQGSKGAESPGVDAIYGSTWITAGAGSVLLLTGSPGDPVVGLHHVKQPMGQVGPLRILHNGETGRTTVYHSTDLLAIARAKGTVSAIDAAAALFDTAKPTAANKETARRRLDSLTRTGLLVVVDEGDKATSKPRLWGPA